jgi:transcriptional regulator with XRE-family HTH domain
MLDSVTVPVTKRSSRKSQPSRLREIRVRKGLSRAKLAELAHMHPNSIKNLENGTTREVTAPNAAALAGALDTPVEQLGLQVRSTGMAPSIRMRELSPNQRALIREILSLPEEQYSTLRRALKRIQAAKDRKS